MGRHQRAASFTEVDHTEASGILADVLRDAQVMVGGSCIGKGLHKAAQCYWEKHKKSGDCSDDDSSNQQDLLSLPGAQNLTPEILNSMPPEEAFYVVDLGVLVSQVYQWRRFFPRIEPFYAVKCNPDPIVIKTLAILGCNFDCASRNEIQLIQQVTQHLPREPDIIFANPCKPRAHLIEAVCKNITLMTFDNATEVQKCASISKNIQLILRIMTDDRGSQCRLSSKFGAPRAKWRNLLAAAKLHGLAVVGVSFHVGSGCRDASRYEMALRDAREIFDMAEAEFGMVMTILDIGGGFPGETHSIWNPAVEINGDEEEEQEGTQVSSVSSNEEDKKGEEHFMFFKEIALEVSPVIDSLFPPESGVRIISEPGRFFVAAAATLCCSVVSTRSNEFDKSFEPEPIEDKEAAAMIDALTRAEEEELLGKVASSIDQLLAETTDNVLTTIHEELDLYSKLYASQQLHQQEFDVYNDKLDLFKEGFVSAADLLGPPEESQKNIVHHTVEGMTYPLVATASDSIKCDEEPTGLLTLAAAGEAAVSGVVLQAVADSAPLQDDFAYYINDGVYGAFNNIMFDHAQIRPRVLQMNEADGAQNSSDKLASVNQRKHLFASTVFGPTCDSMDVIARSVLLPRLKVGDWMYFSNMGAYTMAASSSFNGFTPSKKIYVCSVQPEYFEALIAGPESELAEEKKNESFGDELK